MNIEQFVFIAEVLHISHFLGVLWQIFHASITYGMVRRNVQMMGKLDGTSRKYQETCLFACVWNPYGSLAVLGLPIGAFVGLS